MNLPIVAYGDFISNLIPLGIGLSRYRALPRPMRLFLVFIAINVSSEVVSYSLASHGVSNLWFIHLYDLVTTVLLFEILILLCRSRGAHTVFRLISAVYVAAWFVGKFTFEPFTASDQFTFSGFGTVMVIASTYCLFQLVSLDDLDLRKEYRFWLLAGIFLDHIGNLILFSVLEHYIHLDLGQGITIWEYHWWLNVIVNCFYAGGFCLARQ
jgi:hypothetical protein